MADEMGEGAPIPETVEQIPDRANSIGYDTKQLAEQVHVLKSKGLTELADKLDAKLTEQEQKAGASFDKEEEQRARQEQAKKEREERISVINDHLLGKVAEYVAGEDDFPLDLVDNLRPMPQQIPEEGEVSPMVTSLSVAAHKFQNNDYLPLRNKLLNSLGVPKAPGERFEEDGDGSAGLTAFVIALEKSSPRSWNDLTAYRQPTALEGIQLERTVVHGLEHSGWLEPEQLRLVKVEPPASHGPV